MNFHAPNIWARAHPRACGRGSNVEKFPNLGVPNMPPSKMKLTTSNFIFLQNFYNLCKKSLKFQIGFYKP